jgi:hypothetical protein
MSGIFSNLSLSAFDLYHFYSLPNQFILYICPGQGKTSYISNNQEKTQYQISQDIPDKLNIFSTCI